MKTLLITGATGFIGRHLIKQAVKNGYRVIAAVRKHSNTCYLKEINIPTVILNLENPEHLLSDINNILNTYGNIDALIHNAGITQTLNNEEYYKINTNLTKNLIDAIMRLEGKIPKFIYVSSIAAVGPGSSISFKKISEDDIPHPVTHYGKSKLYAENHIRSKEDLPWIIVRPTAVYGEHEKNFLNVIKSINNGLELYMGSKKQMISFIHVSDLVSSILRLASDKISGQIFNLSDGKDYSIVEVNDIIKSALKKKTISVVLPFSMVKVIATIVEFFGRITNSSPILNKDKLYELTELNWLIDNSKIIKEINYIPKIKFATGITQTIDWYKKNGWL